MKRVQTVSRCRTAVISVKNLGLRTATVTIIARFRFQEAIKPIKPCFDFVRTGYEAGCDKSDPKMCRKILETLDVEPRKAVMIGDNLQHDLLLPKKLGIHMVLLDTRHQKPQCYDL